MPLREEPLLIPLVILLHHLIQALNDTTQDTSTRIVRGGVLPAWLDRLKTDESPSLLRRFIVVPFHNHPYDGRWQETLSNSGPKVIRVGRWVAVDVGEVFRRARQPEHFVTTLNDCFTEPQPKHNAMLIPLATESTLT